MSTTDAAIESLGVEGDGSAERAAEEQRKANREARAQAQSDRAAQHETERLQRVQTQAAEQAAKASKESRKSMIATLRKTQTVPAAEKLAKRLLILLELGAIGGVIYLLRKPLEKFALKAAALIYEAVPEVINDLKQIGDKIEDAELQLRRAMIARYLQDPILMHKIGPGLYTQLVNNANWGTTIHYPDGEYPAAVPQLFLAGTGRGATQLRGSIVRGISIQMFALIKWFVGTSADLQTLGRFELNPVR